jgi:spermidine synthase
VWALRAVAAAIVASLFCFLRETEQAQTAVVIETKIDSGENPVATIYSEDRVIQFLTCGKSVVGAQFLKAEFRDQAAFTGFAVQESAMFAKKNAKRILQLGLGAGIVPTFFREHDMPVDVVEFSAPIVYMAAHHFGYNSCCKTMPANCSDGQSVAECEKKNGHTIIQEARQFLFTPGANNETGKYDIVLSDLFMGSNPGHLYSKQVFEQIQRVWLRADGIVAVNFVGLHVGAGSKSARILARTLRAVFSVVRCYRDSHPSQEPEFATNIVCFASTTPFEFKVPVHHPDLVDPIEGSSFWVMKHFQKWEVLTEVERGGKDNKVETEADEIFTDDFNSLLIAGAQRITEAKLWKHAQDLIPLHIWEELGAV